MDLSGFWATAAQIAVVLLLAVGLEVRYLASRGGRSGLLFIVQTVAGLFALLSLAQSLIFLLDPKGTGSQAGWEVAYLLVGAFLVGFLPLYPNYIRRAERGDGVNAPQTPPKS